MSNKIKDILTKFENSEHSPESSSDINKIIVLCEYLNNLYNQIKELDYAFVELNIEIQGQQDQEETPKYNDLIQDISDINALKSIQNIISNGLSVTYQNQSTSDLLNINSNSNPNRQKIRNALIFTSVLSELDITKEIILASGNTQESLFDGGITDEKASDIDIDSDVEENHDIAINNALLPPVLSIPPPFPSFMTRPLLGSRGRGAGLPRTNHVKSDIPNKLSLGFFKGQQVDIENIQLIQQRTPDVYNIGYQPGLYVQSWIRQCARSLLSFSLSVAMYSNFQVSKEISQKNSYLILKLNTVGDILKKAMDIDFNSSNIEGGVTKEAFLLNVVSTLGVKLEQDLFLCYQEIENILSSSGFLYDADADADADSKKNRLDLEKLKNLKKYPFVLLKELLNEVVSFFPNEKVLALDSFDIDKCKALARSNYDFIDFTDDKFKLLFANPELVVISFVLELINFVNLDNNNNALSMSLENLKQDVYQNFDNMESDFVKDNNYFLQQLIINDFKTIKSLSEIKIVKLDNAIENENSNLKFIQQEFTSVNLPSWLDDLEQDLLKSKKIKEILTGKEISALKINLNSTSVLSNNKHKHLFILLDLSGSMREDVTIENGEDVTIENGLVSSRIEELKKALDSTLSKLNGKDVSISIIGFNQSAVDISQGFLHMRELNDERKKGIIDLCQAGGSTNFHAAFEFMCSQIKLLGDRYDPNKTICLTITDGSFSRWSNNSLSSLKDKLQNAAALDNSAAVPLFCSIAISDQADKKQLKEMMSGFLEDEASLAQNLYKQFKHDAGQNQSIGLSHIQNIYDLFIISGGADKLEFYLSEILLPFVNLEYPEVNINLDLNIKYDKNKLDLGDGDLEIILRQQDLGDVKLLETYDEFKATTNAKGNIYFNIKLTPVISSDFNINYKLDNSSVFELKSEGIIGLLENNISSLSEIKFNILNNIKLNLEREINNLKSSEQSLCFGAGAGAGAGAMPAISRRSSSQATPSEWSMSLMSRSITTVAESQSSSSF